MIEALGKIEITLSNISHAELQRYREIFDALIDCGALQTKSGSITLHFDNLGILQQIEGPPHPVIYRRKSLQGLKESAKLESNIP